MLRDKLILVPEARKGQDGWLFTAEGSVVELLAGTIPDLSHVVASPGVTSDVFRRRGRFVRAA